MTHAHSFEPDWASPPGATVLDILVERRCSVREFAAATHRSTQEVARLLNGVDRLTPDWAQALAEALGASPQFWLSREDQYRSDMERLWKSSGEPDVAWLDELPLADMTKFGWISGSKSKAEVAMNALAFFGVTSAGAWRRQYSQAIEAAAYRASEAFESKPGAVAAWLRQGEIRAAEVDCADWSPSRLEEAIPCLRALTREPDPAVFLPKLAEACSSCGVAIVVARAPDGCRASGATKLLSAKKALVLLSFRHLADDQFWFTVFHEIGHLLRHASEGLFLEGVDVTRPEAEEEADAFAVESLFTVEGARQLRDLPLNKFAIARHARRLGIAPGLVVGQLQALGRVPYRHFNYMKARYVWE